MSGSHQTLLIGGGVGGDPLFSQVQLLLHCDGTNGSTTLVDSSSSPKTGITAYNGATISTAQSKFGGASVLSTATDNSRFSVPAQAGLRVIGDFTVECWVRFNSLSIGTQTFVASYDILSPPEFEKFLFALVVEADQLNAYVFGTPIFAVSDGPFVSPDVWYNVAVTRAGATRSFWLNGVLMLSDTVLSYDQPFDTSWDIGGPNPNIGLFSARGHVDEFRLTIGTARYTANFTPQTIAFPNS